MSPAFLFTPQLWYQKLVQYQMLNTVLEAKLVLDKASANFEKNGNKLDVFSKNVADGCPFQYVSVSIPHVHILNQTKAAAMH